MVAVTYDIRHFHWMEEINTFSGNAYELFDSEGYYYDSFPNRRKQFIIKNYKTGNFRRFRHYKDIYGWSVYSSEDGFYCYINTQPMTLTIYN